MRGNTVMGVWVSRPNQVVRSLLVALCRVPTARLASLAAIIWISANTFKQVELLGTIQGWFATMLIAISRALGKRKSRRNLI